MTIPKRVILSRKGFDTKFGACTSPILSDGRMISLPIPEDPTATDVTTSFGDLGNVHGHSVSATIASLKNSKSDIWKTRKVHLDPDIRPSMRPRNCDDQRGFFGQDGSFETGLRNGGVSDLDNEALFLFYGWFKQVKETRDGFRHSRLVQNEPRTHQQHVIWGWLQVGSHHVVPENGKLPDALLNLDHHPHIEHRKRTTNSIYISRDSLSFDSTKSGSGVFPLYHSDLRLTCPAEHRRMSYWTVPDFIRTAATGGLKTQWDKQPEKAASLFLSRLRTGVHFGYVAP